MMYSQGFALSIKSNNKFLGEKNTPEGREVYLNFGSEYSIYLKNKTNRRAKFQIKVDGKFSHPSDIAYVIDANSSFELERFMLDGDNKKGEKFKFVDVVGSGETPGERDNGLIEVTIKQEKINPPFNIRNISTTVENPKPINPIKYRSSTSDSININYNSAENLICDTISIDDKSLGFMDCSSSKEKEGVTVGGGISNQEFDDVPNFETESETIILRIRLKPTKTSTSSNLGMCPGCNGIRVQTRNDGVKITCPVCNGSGKF